MRLSGQYNIAVLISGGSGIRIAFFITIVILIFELHLQPLDFAGRAAISEGEENGEANKDKHDQLIADDITAGRLDFSALNGGRDFLAGFVTVRFLNHIPGVLVANSERAFQKLLDARTQTFVLLILPKHNQYARSIWK